MTIKRKKSSTLHTRINKQQNNNSTINNNSHSSSNSSNSNSNSSSNSFFKINNKDSKGNKNTKKLSNVLHKKTRILNKESNEYDKLSEFIDDNLYKLKKGHSIKGDMLNKYFYNDNHNNVDNNHDNNKQLNCICENIYDIKKDNNCKCSNMKTYKSQSNASSSTHSISCSNVKNLLNVLPLDKYYMKLRNETKKYRFIELDRFTLQTVINSYIYKLLPHNSINLLDSGVCKKAEYKKYMTSTGFSRKGKYHGYNLISEPDLGSGAQFLLKLLEGKYDKELNITNEDIRYKSVVSFLLQSILIIAHLQSSSIEFFHGNYKPDNLFVKKYSTNKAKYYRFNAFGHKIKVKNMGFAVLIGNFDKSSMSIKSDIKNDIKNVIKNDIKKNNVMKYRLIPPLVSPLLLSRYVNYIIKQFADIDPDTINNNYTIKINKIVISKFISIDKDPTIHILRSAGIKLYRDFDIYTFMVKLLDDRKIREYIIVKKLDITILSFMSKKFKESLFNRFSKNNSFNETTYVIVDIFDKINEPMSKIFTNDYFKILTNLNYHLFKK
jgi:hypothetical protein